jgi:hypothetical protein
MVELEAGDKVTILVGKHAGKTGVVKYPFCDYGDHMLSVDLLDGTNIDVYDDEGSSVEYIGEDKYEYGIQEVNRKTGGVHDPVTDDWMTREDAETTLLERLYAVEIYEESSGPALYAPRLVKRRKAGRIEIV